MDTTSASPSYAMQSTKDKKVAALKVPPHSIEAEQSVIGGLMIDNDSWDVIVERLTENDFYRQEHRLLFCTMMKLAEKNQPFDVITISEALKNLGQLDHVGGEVYLFELSKNTPTAANIKAYADIVRERSVLRQLIAVGGEIADDGYNPGDQSVVDLLDRAEQKVFQIADHGARRTGPIAVKALLSTALERIDHLFHTKQAITGLATGYHDFDHLTSGLQPADLVIIAGRPSMGKTALAMNIAEHAVIKSAKPVLVFSMEMPGDSLAMRMMSSLGRIEQNRVRTGQLQDDDWPRITSAVGMLSEVPLFIDDAPALTPGELRAKARRLAREQGPLALIVIDYLQLMRTANRGENRTTEISEISRSLKALAKELNVPVIALSQLNRSLEQRADRRPMMSDLRESGAIEQDADLIAFICRDEVYNAETRDKGIAEIIIAKQRNGPIGKVRLTFLGQYTRFENFANEKYAG
jgi:replicative DNA helicase